MLAIIEETVTPACLWRENPYRLVSLWDMLRFNAHTFVAVSTNIGQLLMDIRSGRLPNMESAKSVHQGLELIRTECLDLGLKFSAEQAQRLNVQESWIAAAEQSNPIPMRNLEGQLRELQQRICDEMKGRVYLQLNPDNSQLYSPTEPAFGQVVFDNFPSAIDDVVEAGNCLAMDRSTAAVFHLMRVMESALKVLGRE